MPHQAIIVKFKLISK